MANCRNIQGQLALYAGGDLAGREFDAVRSHLATCSSCALDLSEYKSVTALVRRSLEPREAVLPAAARTTVARAAAERVLRGPWWARLVPLPGHQALAAVVPAFLLVVALAIPFAMRGRKAENAGTAPERIEMQAQGGSVRLAWSDGRGRPYRVYKTTDPRKLGRGPAQEVRGNQWVDSEQDSAPVVFYRVE
jgi:anti-sigma factor RsiW